jgi:hypothetical protein
MDSETPDLEKLLRRALADAELPACQRSQELARWAAADLSPEERAEFRRHLDACLECQADLRSYEASGPAWDEPQGRLAAWLSAVKARPRLLVVGLAAATAMALAILAIPPSATDHPLQAKGTWHLVVAVDRDGQVFRASPGIRLMRNDKLGFFLSSGTPGYLTVLYADESRTVVRLYPTGAIAGDQPMVGDEVRVSAGAVVSEGSGCEWIIALFSKRTISEKAALEMGQRMVVSRRDCELGTVEGPGVEAQVLGVRR